MKTLILLLITCLAAPTLYAQPKKKKTIYKYKKYEKFDLDKLNIKGESAAPGDLTLSPRLKRDFANKLPERTNFNPEIRKGINTIR